MPKAPTIGQFLALALGVGCVAAALPVVRDALVRLPGDPLSTAVERFTPLTAEQQTRFADSRRQGSAADLRQLGRMKLAAAESATPDEARRLLDAAITDLEAALAQAPADGFAWADLALARLRRDGPTPTGLAALRMSVAAAPAERALVAWRLAVLFDHQSLFGPDDERALAQQILAGWQADPNGTVKVLSERRSVDMLRRALAEDPAALERLGALAARVR